MNASETATAVESDPRWAAVLARDAASDGRFYYSVRTTGVYCRPSCGARPPRPGNVAFHRSTAEAEAAGFRPCRRCRPCDPPLAERNAALVAELCRMIECEDHAPSLEELARRASMSESHVHRLFKSVTGITPKAYASAHRAARVRRELRTSPTVTDAIYESGYNSNGRFYERSDELLGMTPTRFRAGGDRTEIRFAIGQCSLGAILVAATSIGVCAILLGDDPEELAHDLERRFPKATIIGADADFERLVATVVGHVEHPRPSSWCARSPGEGSHGLHDLPRQSDELPLDIRGTVFQQRVWQALRGIPAGSTATYAEIARAIGAPKAARAVAQACAANSIAVAIPCHRVVRLDGSLSGYRWGVERKRRLLERESRAES
ncbi:MAG TPA: methylated-DNA--[protein]-cysteine S-methyltransferase [Candidatus Limnocylindrales bacterium]|nr:methylated-DNA--[protein]-cysteine S-methyltransferase [Candidatus Limnocylindrales bacterium]